FGATAAAASSPKRRPEPPSGDPGPDQAEPDHTDHDPPPGEGREAVPGDEVDHGLDHQPAADERNREADGDDAAEAPVDPGSALHDVPAGGGDHGGNGEEEGEFGGRALVETEGQTAGDGRARTDRKSTRLNS